MKGIFIFLVIPVTVLIISFFGFYAFWNQADPVTTCASCHEITPSVSTMQSAAHREIKCFECHGTALENGIHSLKEKANMVVAHLSEEKWNTDIRMTETQVLEVMERCANCHQSEYTKWKSGRHSTTYANIFLNPVHNSVERLYWDCFRCHGMFYESDIYNLVTPVSTQGPWELKNPEKAEQPAIPCLSCHQVHTQNEPYQSLAHIQSPNDIPDRNPAFGLYLRSDHMFLRADFLPVPDMNSKGIPVKFSKDPSQVLCVQCHAPGAFHGIGTNDDRTPTGVHEGLNCKSCHEPHSNNPKNSCSTCHPAISNCGLDVETMNTTYSSPASMHNIHFVSCEDCHGEKPGN
ncbi:MAG: cytochrome c3 family protein [Cyclobacteriaceae bacterium]|nr:cytochrome c3 family protein [Cyclobacteriaceae bacterium]